MSKLNFLNPESDQHQISPCNINTLQNTVVMRIKDRITQDEFAWYFNNFSWYFYSKYVGATIENLHFDLRV